MSMGRSKERREAWKAANREKRLAYHSEYNRRYYQAHREELLYKKKCRACGVTPAIERLAADVQQLHTDITNKVAEFEKLFENWE